MVDMRVVSSDVVRGEFKSRIECIFKVTMKLQTFLFKMVVTSCISVQYLRKYGVAKYSDYLYTTCILNY
jgi:hypothetical protein